MDYLLESVSHVSQKESACAPKGMHIKQVTICGFKTYRDATVVSNLHEGYNVIGARRCAGIGGLCVRRRPV